MSERKMEEKEKLQKTIHLDKDLITSKQTIEENKAHYGKKT